MPRYFKILVKRQDGISIIEALVSVALTLIVATSLSQVTNQFAKVSKKMTFFEDADKLAKEVQALLSNQQTCTQEFTTSRAQQLIYNDTDQTFITLGTSIRFCPVSLENSSIDINAYIQTQIECTPGSGRYQQDFISGRAKIFEIRIKHEKFTGLSNHNLNDNNDPVQRFSRQNVASVSITMSDTENPDSRVTKSFPILLETDPTTFEVVGCYSGATANLQSGLGDQACGTYQTGFSDLSMTPPITNYIIRYGYDPDSNDCYMLNPPPDPPPPPPPGPETDGHLLCTGSGTGPASPNESSVSCPSATMWIDECYTVPDPDVPMPPAAVDLGNGFTGNTDITACDINGNSVDCRWEASLTGTNLCQARCHLKLTEIPAAKALMPNCVDTW